MFHYFNSHPHEDDDPPTFKHITISCNFNSHPHEEDDHVFPSFPVGNITFQLTSSRRGWRCWQWTYSVSIIFQLTSSRRGWLCYTSYSVMRIYFNSHPHEEDDDITNNHICRIRIISTHILTKRMTFAKLSPPISEYFNSHPHEEDDSNSFSARLPFIVFQLTSSRRGWRLGTATKLKWISISTHILTKRMT